MAMSNGDKSILQTNRTFLVDNITDVDGVVSGLFSKKVITEYMMQDILAKETRFKQLQELLTMLPRRGPNAMDIVYQVLVEAEEDIAADIIRPELKNQRIANKNTKRDPVQESSATPEEDELPTQFPDPNDREIYIGICGKEMNDIFRKVVEGTNTKYVYPMTRSPRGLCLIINNSEFQGPLDNRNGTQFDTKNLYSVFTQLHFKVVVMENLTADEMRKSLDDYQDHSHYDCFVLVILSHGTEGCVCGVDGNNVKIEEIILKFDSFNCQSLKGKPKLFFIQACQGNIEDAGVACEISVKSRNLANVNINDSKETTDDIGGNRATKADIFVAMATTPGYVAWRNADIGSWFIQAVVYAFKRYAHQCSLNSLMTKVNYLVQLAETSHEAPYKQTSESKSSLSKEFYFFPGLFQAAQNQVQPST